MLNSFKINCNIPLDLSSRRSTSKRSRVWLPYCTMAKKIKRQDQQKCPLLNILFRKLRGHGDKGPIYIERVGKSFVNVI